MKNEPDGLTIKILGNGGAINEGLPYNSFMINATLLCELPPDIMPSLHRNHVPVSGIKRVFISHLHGDHVFGLPFFVLSSFFESEQTGEEHPVTMIGPKGLQELARDLLISAFRKNHPCVTWMDRYVRFIETDASGKPVLMDGYETLLFRLDHMMETYGFLLSLPQSGAHFAYVADTLWCGAVQTIIETKPKLVLIDLNGDPGDVKPVHLSNNELVEKGLPISGNNTLFVGTHLRRRFQAKDHRIVCSEPGMRAMIPPANGGSAVIMAPVEGESLFASAGFLESDKDARSL